MHFIIDTTSSMSKATIKLAVKSATKPTKQKQDQLVNKFDKQTKKR